MYEELIKQLRDNAEFLVRASPSRLSNSFAETMSQAADAIEELSHDYEKLAEDFNGAVELLHKREKPRWIPVTDRLPESQGPFLTRYGYGDASIETGQFFYGVLYYFFADAEPHWQHASVGVEVTHWMPLPEPPKGE